MTKISEELSTIMNTRWIIKDIDHLFDLPYHQLFLGESSKTIDEFLQQVNQDAETSGKEPLLFMKLRRKGWKLPTKVKKALVEADIKPPQGKSNTIGILVAERAEFSADIAGVNHIQYTGSLGDDFCATWHFYDMDEWLKYVVDRA